MDWIAAGRARREHRSLPIRQEGLLDFSRIAGVAETLILRQHGAGFSDFRGKPGQNRLIDPKLKSHFIQLQT
jgi:hypothetical protein